MKYPLLEGATLVVVGTAGATVALYDKGLAGKTFLDQLSYQLTISGPYTGDQLRIDNVGADGQTGASRAADPGLSGEVTTINGTAVAGPGSSASNDSDWNGHIGDPMPELWDNTSHDLRSFVSTGTTTLNVEVTTHGDCLTPVANVIAVR